MKTHHSVALTLALMLVSAAPMLAQESLPGQRAASNVRTSDYPRLLDDHRAVFRLKAPDAQKVSVDIGGKYDMTRDADGVWTVTTPPLSEGFHYYQLIVDGVAVNDPASETYYGGGRVMSGFEVSYPESTASRFAMRDVPHGAITQNRYYSPISGKWKRMFVYTPAGYDATTRRYPVLYIMHGGGEDERGWATQGLTDIILDNLIAEGKAQPMIVVMPDGNTPDIEGELIGECLPFVESHYRTLTGRDHRALAGLSMGGIQTLNVGLTHTDRFAYLGVFSSGWWANPPKGFAKDGDAEKYYAMLAANPQGYNDALREFWISMGGKEDIAYDNCRIMRGRFDALGIRYTYFETPGGHTWPVWRESLYQFAPLLFQQHKEVTNEGNVRFDDYYTKASTEQLTADANGYLRRWRMLDPVKTDVKTNTVFTDSYVRQALNYSFMRPWSKKLPRDGEKVKVDGARLTWHALDSKLFNNKLFRFASTRDKEKYGVIFWVATEIEVADTLTDVRLSAGSNGASMWWVDGQEALMLSGDRRMVSDDGQSARLTLPPGRHTVHGAVINGPGMSDFCVRFIDSNGQPVSGITQPAK